MNIFYVDEDPVIAAQSLVDKHVVKMILESAQLLSTAHRVLDGNPVDGVRVNIETGKARKVTAWQINDERDSLIYSATHINHPSAVWCRTSVENYNWLVDHFFALIEEYKFRYEKIHKCFGDLSYTLQSPPHGLRDWDWTPMPSCMDEIYKISDNPIDNYRNYYRIGKVNLHKWTKRNPPEWL